MLEKLYVNFDALNYLGYINHEYNLTLMQLLCILLLDTRQMMLTS